MGNSIKHIIDAEGALTMGNQSVVPVSVAVPNVDTTTFKPGDVRVGSVVNGIFFSIFMIGTTGAPISGSANWYVSKEHEGQAVSFPVPNETGTSKVRNQIFHEEKGLVGSGDGTAMAFKGVIAIPKGMRRMREGDVINVHLRCLDTTNDCQFCVKAIYKSWF